MAGKSQYLCKLWGISQKQKRKHTRTGLLRQIVGEGLRSQGEGEREVIATLTPSFLLEVFALESSQVTKQITPGQEVTSRTENFVSSQFW